MENHWIFEGKPFDVSLIGKNVGFVYIITNNISGKAYIGRKYFKMKKVFQKNLKKFKQSVDSNWPIYTGSSDKLNEDIKTLGKENFTFEIIALGLTTGVVNFLEVHFQFKYGVLFSDKFYNENILGKYYTDLVSTYPSKTLLSESFKDKETQIIL